MHEVLHLLRSSLLPHRVILALAYARTLETRMKQKLRLPRPSQAGKHTPPHDPSPRLPASSYAKCRCSKRGPLHISHQLRHSRVPSLHCDKSNCVPEDTRAVFSCLRTSIPDHWVSQICRAAEGSIAKRREGDGRISSRLNIISISVRSLGRRPS